MYMCLLNSTEASHVKAGQRPQEGRHPSLCKTVLQGHWLSNCPSPCGWHASWSVGSALSVSTSSRITTLVLGSSGRLGGRRKDKNHLTSKYPFMAFNPSLHSIFYPSSFQSSASHSGGWVSSGEFGGWNPFCKFLPSSSEAPDLYSAPTDIPTELKPKRQRNNDTQIWDLPFY